MAPRTSEDGAKRCEVTERGGRSAHEEFRANQLRRFLVEDAELLSLLSRQHRVV
ncbi:hypothetical protein LZ318_41540 [Saccharopolyspora indica]|uniref:hypothetical protein n=1 Tax=Saccharopolyspora indica TaxID=1229659 RepID=UPI0022EA68C8|nr:hypothetical protein [Saccharopolyspora indica]MDA3646726.1 hypothetical protein [Saccharopolyspora indica]